jgi:4-hydroxyproline epimerase
MACLYADGKLQPEQSWRQEGILGTVFVGSVEAEANDDGSQDPQVKAVLPTIRGRAWITAESTLLFDPTDPFQEGIAF